MIGTFADAFYYIALINPADRAHAEAVRISATLTRPIITTTWVLVEVADALNAPPRRRFAHRFLEQLAARSNTQVIPAEARWYDRGMALYGSRADKSWSLTDCISFEVMAEFGLTEALTGDHHFEQAGFRALMKTP
ncbi:type II toxin-antitoxin system VapC family toxin [Tundrisphaera lichenicola]|uniref:type II toxin-antitoxin system VapC family toxin n=1 Tax=Tundrisphaera lichenicola TaxID=2029860 RepID=UPI003EB920A5